MHTQNHTKILRKANPNNPKIHRVFQEIKAYMQEKFGYAALPPGHRVPRSHLAEAIAAVRGTDNRTIKKWMRDFEKFKLIRWIGGEIWEIVGE